MTKVCLTRVGVAIIIAILAAFVAWQIFVAGGDGNPVERPILSNTKWSKYSGQKIHVSFEYPAEWAVIEEISPIKDRFDLMLCPPNTQMPNGIHSDFYCIVFYTKERLLHPQNGFYDESDLFADFSEYMRPYEYDYAGAADYRFVRFNYLLRSQDDFTIDLLGLYLRNKNDMVGMSQGLCVRGRIDECVLIFKHVLDSVTL